jgi:ribosomal protein S13
MVLRTTKELLHAENVRLRAEVNDWHHVADLRSAEIERLRATIAKHHTLGRTTGEQVLPNVFRCYACGETWQT